MRRSELNFERPAGLAATRPAEARGLKRDEGRLLVSSATGQQHVRFIDLKTVLQPGDLLVVNESATLPASLPAQGKIGEFRLNLSTNYGAGLWLTEPRWSPAKPGPIDNLVPGEKIQVAGLEARLIFPFPGLPRLWFVQFEGDVGQAMQRAGQPIRYGYLKEAYGLKHYQTLFATEPGSAEMPSAAYPFTPRAVKHLAERGIELAGIVLHTGVSSLEVEVDEIDDHPLYPEPYRVPRATAEAVNKARANRRRVIAVGTTVVRALESAWDGQQVRPSSGFTRLYIRPGHVVNSVDGLLTGLHDPLTSHVAMLYALAGQELIREAYTEAIQEKYHWHEFGDSHLILSGSKATVH
jgi:S-adenosylmethionine:tRNA ribosyltransferase-isomerase